VLHHSITGARDGTGPLRRSMTARFDRTGTRLMTCGRETVFWNPETGTELARVPEAAGGQAVFLVNGEWVAAAADGGVRRWSAESPYKPVSEKLYGLAAAPDWIRHVSDATRDGKWVAVVDQGVGIVAVVPTGGDRPPVKLSQPGAFEARFSPDGTLIATCSIAGNMIAPVRVWNVSTGRQVRELPRTNYSRAEFTPDGQWLVTGTASEYQFWKVGTWERGLSIPRPGRNNTGPMAFSADGRMMACMPEPLTVKLIDPNTGTELATLTPPTPTSVEDLCFSPDGTKLVVSTGTAVVYLWDLRLIRRQLR
jgi:WD40 repeat protein